MKTEPYQSGHVSIYDALEHLQISTQLALSKCEKKPLKLLEKVFSKWERTLNYVINEKQSKELEFFELKEKYCQSKNTELKLRIKLSQKKNKEKEMIREIQAIKDHLEEGKEMWAKQIKKIEEVMQEQERSKQKIESLYQQRLSEIDSELDDIMHIHKNQLGLSQKLGDILPALFSQEELQEEKKIALGEIVERKFNEIAIEKIEKGSEYDINSDNSLPSMNFEHLNGTQKIVFQRLLELRKKVYKFKHEDTACTEVSSESLPSELKSISSIKQISKILSKTSNYQRVISNSVLVSLHAGLIFGIKGSEKYREGLTDLLKSDKLSISQRESIVFNLINGEIANKTKTVQCSDIIQQEDWGNMSSIRADTKENEMSQDLNHIFSKASIEFSKESTEIFKENPSKIFFNNIEPIVPAINLKDQVNITKDNEFSEMSIIKDFSRNVSISTRRKMSEESKKDSFIAEIEEGIISNKKFLIEQREPSSSFILPPKTNLFFVPEPLRPRSNPRVSLKPEESNKSRDESLDDSASQLKAPTKPNLEPRKPISMLSKLPILPKPPSEVKKITIKNFRGRSLQPLQNSNPRIAQSPPTRKVAQTDIKSASPNVSIKFRMRRFKEAAVNGLKNGKIPINPSKPAAKKSNK
jgi:hypothetical protein